MSQFAQAEAEMLTEAVAALERLNRHAQSASMRRQIVARVRELQGLPLVPADCVVWRPLPYVAITSTLPNAKTGARGEFRIDTLFGDEA